MGVQMGPRAPGFGGMNAAPRELHVGAGALAIFLDHEDSALRLLVCGALGSCGPFARGHAEVLKKMWDGHGDTSMQDKSAAVRKAAMTAITQMGTKPSAKTNVLLTDPTIVAMSTPMYARRDAGKLVE